MPFTGMSEYVHNICYKFVPLESVSYFYAPQHWLRHVVVYNASIAGDGILCIRQEAVLEHFSGTNRSPDCALLHAKPNISSCLFIPKSVSNFVHMFGKTSGILKIAPLNWDIFPQILFLRFLNKISTRTSKTFIWSVRVIFPLNAAQTIERTDCVLAWNELVYSWTLRKFSQWPVVFL